MYVLETMTTMTKTTMTTRTTTKIATMLLGVVIFYLVTGPTFRTKATYFSMRADTFMVAAACLGLDGHFLDPMKGPTFGTRATYFRLSVYFFHIQ